MLNTCGTQVAGRSCSPSVAPLAIEFSHGMLSIAVTGSCSRRNRLLDTVQVLRSQMEIEGTQCLVQSIAPAGSYQRNDVLATGKNPRDGHLRDRGTTVLGDSTKCV